jgi:catechol 2,3-dioxygenase-like lactoylglutathione lyase family enzyme
MDTPDLRLEVVVIPVADVDRAKAFYVGLGWRLDADFPLSETFRVVQFTPPGSPASIHFGSGIPQPAGPLQASILVVDDIEAARDDLVSRGADVGEIWHADPEKGQAPGIDPERRSYFTRADFNDPDGNQWELQEITERLPGRV